MVGNAGIGGKPRRVVTKLCGNRVRQEPPDRKKPLSRLGQSLNDLFDDGNRLVRIESVQARIRVHAAGRMHDPETVRRTDCPLAVPARGGRGYALFVTSGVSAPTGPKTGPGAEDGGPESRNNGTAHTGAMTGKGKPGEAANRLGERRGTPAA